jgi:hypothetical protein
MNWGFIIFQESKERLNVEKNRFKNSKYVTRGVNSTIGIEIQAILWSMIEESRSKGLELDYLLVYRLSIEMVNGDKVQVIEFSQEVPEYKSQKVIKTDNPIDEKIFVISTNDVSHPKGEYSTMMLAHEY